MPGNIITQPILDEVINTMMVDNILFKNETEAQYFNLFLRRMCIESLACLDGLLNSCPSYKPKKSNEKTKTELWEERWHKR